METLDPGNYTRGTGMSRVSVMAAAKEHGDTIWPTHWSTR